MDVTERVAAVFTSARPRPELAARLAVFEPLIGSWDLVVRDYDENGGVRTTDAEWHFGWALDGRAVTDIWISPSRASRVEGDSDTDGEWGMSLRFYDPGIDAFRSTWLGPGRGWVIPFVGKQTENGFEIEADTDGVQRRWIFTDLTTESFSWRAEETLPNGTPFVRQRFTATRTVGG
ncbi:hypothetical protein BS329_35460 [Amycolatopsis coloradensis]|uniref:DUF1579 domain-containing protein n=1 Tax=Amycolatopsis coloradensis TaxID=76021 RepID=A0A1R0KHC8_9PSEU|nr:hypothetical protein [Amycolatopsis coloradensis]OLZ45048.1 hypothetical protein BS329_35460 [Amycolatopsis coloradensis]